jgi:hypothetical protein
MCKYSVTSKATTNKKKKQTKRVYFICEICSKRKDVVVPWEMSNSRDDFVAKWK